MSCVVKLQLQIEITLQIEMVISAEKKSGFHMTYFIIPKKGSRLWPILDMSVLNQALHKLLHKMLTESHPQVGSYPRYVCSD